MKKDKDSVTIDDIDWIEQIKKIKEFNTQEKIDEYNKSR